MLCFPLCPAGSSSLSFSQPRMHHSSGRLPDQHHGLWGVCPPHPSASLLSSWVHLQLWDRRSEVTKAEEALSSSLHQYAGYQQTCNIYNCFYEHLASPIMAPWRALYPCTPLTAPLHMKLWWDREPPARWAYLNQRFVFIHVCDDRADPSLLWLLRQQCSTLRALSCLEREELLLPSVEKVNENS